MVSLLSALLPTIPTIGAAAPGRPGAEAALPIDFGALLAIVPGDANDRPALPPGAARQPLAAPGTDLPAVQPMSVADILPAAKTTVSTHALATAQLSPTSPVNPTPALVVAPPPVSPLLVGDDTLLAPDPLPSPTISTDTEEAAPPSAPKPVPATSPAATRGTDPAGPAAPPPTLTGHQDDAPAGLPVAAAPTKSIPLATAATIPVPSASENEEAHEEPTPPPRLDIADKPSAEAIMPPLQQPTPAPLPPRAAAAPDYPQDVAAPRASAPDIAEASRPVRSRAPSSPKRGEAAPTGAAPVNDRAEEPSRTPDAKAPVATPIAGARLAAELTRTPPATGPEPAQPALPSQAPTAGSLPSAGHRRASSDTDASASPAPDPVPATVVGNAPLPVPQPDRPTATPDAALPGSTTPPPLTRVDPAARPIVEAVGLATAPDITPLVREPTSTTAPERPNIGNTVASPIRLAATMPPPVLARGAAAGSATSPIRLGAFTAPPVLAQSISTAAAPVPAAVVIDTLTSPVPVPPATAQILNPPPPPVATAPIPATPSPVTVRAAAVMPQIAAATPGDTTPATTPDESTRKPVRAEPAFRAFAAALFDAARDPAAAAATVAPAAPAAPLADQRPLDLTQPRWPHAMVDRIERLRDEASLGDTRIRLIPDALGTIDVALRRDGETVHVAFRAEQAETRQLLAEARPELTALAEARGIKLADPAPAATTGGWSNAQTGSNQSFAGNDRAPRQQQQPSTPAASPRAATAAEEQGDDTRIA